MVENQAGNPIGWERREQPPFLYRRFQFDGYAQTRVFLEGLAEISKELGCYPDSSFGTTYVNVTIRPRDGERLTEQDAVFAARVTTLFEAPGQA